MRDGAWHCHTGDFSEGAACHTNVVSVGMCGVKLRRQSDAPVLVGWQWFRHIMQVFSLRVNELAQHSGLIETSHCMQVFVEIRSLKHHVFKAAGANRLEKFLCVFERP